uniref:Soluble lytic murein transglycosylase-like protein n=1 Tax=Desulfovibrio sp. U5L TaxID=596152 RepID=I2Q3Z2_9BACT
MHVSFPAAALFVGVLAGSALAAGPKIVSSPMPATEIHGVSLPDPVAAAKRDASLHQAGYKFADKKAVGCRYPAVIEDGKLIRLVNSYSRKNGLDPRLVYALIEQESRFNACAVSPKGAQGLMQIMPDTQKLLGLTEPFDPERNIAAGTRYLKAMLDQFQTEVQALAAYNAGPGAVAKHGGVPPYDETKDYVLKVVDRYFFLRLRYPAEGIGVIHQKLAASEEPRPAATEKP